MTRILKITDGVMRHMATRRLAAPHTAPPAEPEPAAQSVPTPTYAEANTSSQEE